MCSTTVLDNSFLYYKMIKNETQDIKIILKI